MYFGKHTFLALGEHPGAVILQPAALPLAGSRAGPRLLGGTGRGRGRGRPSPVRRAGESGCEHRVVPAR